MTLDDNFEPSHNDQRLVEQVLLVGEELLERLTVDIDEERDEVALATALHKAAMIGQRLAWAGMAGPQTVKKADMLVNPPEAAIHLPDEITVTLQPPASLFAAAAADTWADRYDVDPGV